MTNNHHQHDFHSEPTSDSFEDADLHAIDDLLKVAGKCWQRTPMPTQRMNLLLDTLVEQEQPLLSTKLSERAPSHRPQISIQGEQLMKPSLSTRFVGISLLMILVLVGIVGFAYFSPRSGSSPASGKSSDIPPTQVTLSVSAPNIAPTTAATLTIPLGTVVTLTVIPDHPLLPFQTYTMGIYAHDPYGFSELQDCKYPNTATCTFMLSYVDYENTDYTKGTHTFTAFLGDIGGSINYNSNNITITWQ